MSSFDRRFASMLVFSLIFLMGCFTVTSQAQKLKTMASNTFNGAMTGGLLGGATMALQDSDDFAPARFGVGLGTLGGLAIGIHDVARTSEGEMYMIEGTFNRGDVTTIIILLDSIYGGATGALVGTAIQLMVNEPLVEGVQYGAGAGVWGGFLFGMIDAFYLSSHTTRMASAFSPSTRSNSTHWLSVQREQTRVTFLQPDMYSIKKMDSQQINRETGMSLSMVEVSVQL